MAKKVNNSGYYKVKEVAELLEVAESTAYRIMRDLNKELQKKGYYTFAGKVPKTYLEERFFYKKQSNKRLERG
ncbi:DeoR family transcriptional regulator [Clostridioides difficile]|uniref:DeoR family transcriptional regulator n=1 Tax=Clostridioides difficile TaxID=1496 RepID=UPI00097FFFBB|nr:DeoR family transcriptional regulator [Clostridioides difficile]MCU6001557.1 DeoR family transcriptional regulator [Clostridioides difficile]MCU6076014.1 DeoR family transcriptional regulator [Clostridioides difficile]MDB2813807.1 hypothetical protein [Clostridioides difficile]MDB2829154.1 hypothetical protein [Clostridioides difficile]MDB2887358.1 hypothetical protein [Clostridioides difficile]